MKLRLAGLVVSVGAVACISGWSLEANVIEAPVDTIGHAPQEPAVVALPEQVALAMPITMEVGMRRYGHIVDEASRAHGVDRSLVHALILAESSYDPNAVSAAGASGLMQLMPGTAREHGVSDLLDPAKNVHAGVRHLKGLLAQFDGDVELALAAYNAGAGSVIRAGHRIPDNPETTAFVPKVMDYQRRFRGDRLAMPSAPPSAAGLRSPGTR